MTTKEFIVNIATGMAIGLIAISFIYLAIFGVHWSSSATTNINIHTPKVGITCATLVTTDGVAISCWKD